MGFISGDILKLIVSGDASGEPTSQTSKKVARHVLVQYHGRVTWVLDRIEEGAKPIDFDGDIIALQAFKRVIREAKKSVDIWKKKEMNDIEEGA